VLQGALVGFLCPATIGAGVESGLARAMPKKFIFLMIGC
jgi:hypothetical protein